LRGLEIRKAGEKGLGVFATRPIRSGTPVVRYYGEARWIWDIPENLREFCLQVDYDRYVVPRKESFGWYVNHSCEPNCVVRGERRIVTWRDIEKGEEITFDYSTNVGWDEFKMKCMCASKSCRGVIGSYSRLDSLTKMKFGNNISRYLQGEMNQRTIR
jgi:SET domain-containing protein